MRFSLHLWGELACFRRPEFARDLVTYDIISPLAARRAFDAVYGARAMRWVVRRIAVLNQIKLEWVPLKPLVVGGPPRRMQRLRDVSYIITAECVLAPGGPPNETIARHAETFRHNAQHGLADRQPFLGLPEFPAAYTLVSDGEEALARSDLAGSGLIDLGWMMLETKGEGRPFQTFVRSRLIDGVCDIAEATQDDLAA